MKPRTKSICAAAILFTLDSLALLFASFVQASFIIQRPSLSPLRLLLVLLLLTVFSTVAIGIWRLSSWARLAGCVLSGLSLCYFVIAMFVLHPEMRTYDTRKWAVFTVALVISILWRGSPLYFLTRPSSVTAFHQPANT